MRKKISSFILLLLAFVLLSACGNGNPETNISTIMYDFKEPTTFPFNISEVSTDIDIEAPDHLHQFIFRYYATNQLYIK